MTSKFDERDVIFARMRYQQVPSIYENYYKLNPNKQQMDDYLRSLPGLNSEKAVCYDKLIHPFVNSGFDLISQFSKLESTVSPIKTVVNTDEIMAYLKHVAKMYNMRLAFVKMEDDMFYHTKARPFEQYGQPVLRKLKTGIVLSLPMIANNIAQAPKAPEMEATIIAYMQQALLTNWIKAYLNDLGYQADAHYDGHYDVVLPVVAQKAGLGSIAKMGLLVDEMHGPSVRLALITTDLEVTYTTQKNVDVMSICDACHICVDKCLGKAIYNQPISTSAINHERCYEVWAKIGTDCAYCLKVCPLSNPLHFEKLKACKTSDDISAYLAQLR